MRKFLPCTTCLANVFQSIRLTSVDQLRWLQDVGKRRDQEAEALAIVAFTPQGGTEEKPAQIGHL